MPSSWKGRNSAERAPTTARTVPVATPRHVRARCDGVMSECHSPGRVPKRWRKRSRKLCVSAISGRRISACRPARKRVGNGLEKHLGFAAAGDAIEQRHAELIDRYFADGSEGLALFLVQRWRTGIAVGGHDDRRRGYLHPLERPCTRQPLDHRSGDATRTDQCRLGPGAAVGNKLERARSCCGLAVRQHAGFAIRRHRPFRLERFNGPQDAAEHKAWRRERVAGDPLNGLQKLFAERWDIVDNLDVFQPVVGKIVGRRSPDHAQRQPPDQRHRDDGAALDSLAVRHAVRVRPFDRHAHHHRRDVAHLVHDRVLFTPHRNCKRKVGSPAMRTTLRLTTTMEMDNDC